MLTLVRLGWGQENPSGPALARVQKRLVRHQEATRSLLSYRDRGR
jgi:hypothetical protein